MSFPFGVTVTVLRPTEPDRYGHSVFSPHHTIAGCAYAPSGNPVEVLGLGDTVTYSDTLFVPFGSDVKATDRIEFPDGTVWEVDGQPGSWQSPYSGWKPGMQVVLKRTAG